MTVSRALRGDETVSAKTREMVRATARDLGYVYDASATAFRTQKSGFVAITLPSINNANFAETYRALTNTLGQGSMQLLLGATNYRVENEEKLLKQLLARNPEALVLTGGSHTQGARDLVAAVSCPVVEMWDLPEAPLGHSVGFSNAAAMGVMVDHLVARDRSKLAFIGASDGTDFRGAERRRGAVERASDHAVSLDFWDAGPAPVSMREGAKAVRENADRLGSIDALLCVSDTVAFGALSECKRLGLDIPRDVAVTGFGLFDVAAVSAPQITTIDVGAGRIGEEVATLLERLFRGEDAPRHIEIDVKLVPGGTS